MDAHDLVCKLKELALSLGRTPTRAEFEAGHVGGKYQLEKLFKTYTTLVTAAGLDPAQPRRRKRIGNEIFEKDLEKHLDHQPHRVVEIKDYGPYPTLATISDIHWPFENQRVINRFYEYVGDVSPEWVTLNGDAHDFYGHSRFPRSHNVFTPRDEEKLSRSKNEVFWTEIQKRSPTSKCYQLMGNHDLRPLKRVLETYPEAEDWIAEKIKSLFTFPGVKTIEDPRQELMIREDIAIFHGYRSGLGDHRDYTLMNCVIGHTHKGGVTFKRIRGQTLWELNSGLAGDPEAKGLTYTPQKISVWTPGFGAINRLGPRFISL